MVRPEGKDKRFIYCKGNPEDMLERLRDREMRKNLLEKISNFRQTKAEILIYGKKEMSKSEFESY